MRSISDSVRERNAAWYRDVGYLLDWQEIQWRETFRRKF